MRFILSGLLVLFLGSVWSFAAAETVLFEGHPVHHDRVLVRFKPESPVCRAKQARFSSQSLSRFLGMPRGAALERNPFEICQARRIKAAPDVFSGTDLSAPFLVVRLNGKMSVKAALQKLRRHPWIKSAEPDPLGQGGDVIPTDPDYGLQYHHDRIQSPKVWDVTQGSHAVVVAVLDTGINSNLVEFAGRVIPGYDYANDDNNPADDHNQGHGTSVAGVIGANANNGTLVAGMNWNCRIMPIKVLNENNSGFYSWWASGIYHAISNGADVINLSAGGFTDNAGLEAAVLAAIDAGVIFVTITHNDGTANIRFPGRMLEPITVGAVETNDVLASFSNRGAAVDLVAPGRNIYTVSHTGSLIFWFGTSFAAPQVTGLAALLKGIDPSIDHYAARTLICAGAEDQVGDALDVDGWDERYGWGRLNAWNSVQLALERAQAGVANTNAVVRWKTPSNAASREPYKLMRTTDLQGGGWTDVTGDIVYGSATQAQVEVTDSVSTQQFYRLEVYVPPSGMEP